MSAQPLKVLRCPGRFCRIGKGNAQHCSCYEGLLAAKERREAQTQEGDHRDDQPAPAQARPRPAQRTQRARW